MARPLVHRTVHKGDRPGGGSGWACPFCPEQVVFWPLFHKVMVKGQADALHVRAIREVAQGGSAVDPLIAERLSGRRETAGADREILDMMGRGLGYAEMAQALGTTQEAVDRRVTDLFGRLAKTAGEGGAAVDELHVLGREASLTDPVLQLSASTRAGVLQSVNVVELRAFLVPCTGVHQHQPILVLHEQAAHAEGDAIALVRRNAFLPERLAVVRPGDEAILSLASEGGSSVVTKIRRARRAEPAAQTADAAVVGTPSASSVAAPMCGVPMKVGSFRSGASPGGSTEPR